MTRAAVISGLGSFLPEEILTNEMLAKKLNTTEEWISSRTGVQQRHLVSDNCTTGDLAIAAAKRALASAKITQVKAVVLATTTPDYACPATAPMIAAKLGMTGVLAFDVSAACSGFIYGLAIVNSLICAGLVDSALLIGADVFTRMLDPNNLPTRALFGDGAGAIVLRAGNSDECGALLAFDLGSDGNQVDLLMTPTISRQNRMVAENNHYFQMEGKAVFNQAVTHMSASVQRVMTTLGWQKTDVDYLVPHQANIRILRSVADQLEVEFEKVITNVAEVGNTVAASIPLALDYGVQHGLLQAGKNMLLTSFGAGLTWGTVALRSPAITVKSQ